MRVPHRAVLPAALTLGLTGDLLLRGSQGPGLNVLLFFLALAFGIRTATRVAGLAPNREAWSWIGAGVLLASGLVLRAAPGLQALAFVSASAAFAFWCFLRSWPRTGSSSGGRPRAGRPHRSGRRPGTSLHPHAGRRLLPRLAQCRRGADARRLLERWAGDAHPDADWRSWNRSVARARAAVRAEAAGLRSLVGPDDTCAGD